MTSSDVAMGSVSWPRGGDALESVFWNDAQLIEECASIGNNNFTFFLIPESNFKVNNPMTLKKSILSKVTDQTKVSQPRKTRAGQIIITAYNKQTAFEILKIKKIEETNIKVKLSLDNLLGSYVIRGIDQQIPLSEIKEDLENQNIRIFSLNRFAKKIDEKLTPLKTIKIQTPTTNNQIPQKVHIALEIFYIHTYFEKARQCRNCWRFGHNKNTCRSKCRCPKCGLEHQTDSCNALAVSCINCKGEHQVDSLDCPFRQEEDLILQYKNKERVSYSEARDRARSSVPGTQSFSQKVKASEQQSDNLTQIVKELIEPLMNQLIIIQQNQTWMINTLIHCEIIHADPVQEKEGGSSNIGQRERIPREGEVVNMDFDTENAKRINEDTAREQNLKKLKRQAIFQKNNTNKETKNSPQDSPD